MTKSTNFSAKINKIKKENILPMACAAAALRDEKKLRGFIVVAQENGIENIELYESLLQNYLFTGYPSAMISLKILSEYISNINDQPIESWDLNTYRERGTINCKNVYGKKFNKLISNVNGFSPDLSEWLVLEGYGKVMGRQGLSFKKRELNNIAVLTVQQFEDQLFSHINGGFRTGSTLRQIQSVIEDLKIFDKREIVEFGRKVFKRFLKQKGIE